MELKIEGEALEAIAAAIQCHIRRMKRDLKHREKTAEVYEHIGEPYRSGLIREALPARVARIEAAERLLEEIRENLQGGLKKH